MKKKSVHECFSEFKRYILPHRARCLYRASTLNEEMKMSRIQYIKALLMRSAAWYPAYLPLIKADVPVIVEDENDRVESSD